ncbi:glycosyltransferase family 25 protein [Serratia inhibens]|uniref:glycosyltransferase family 25 protein n=1 Tax=Serratia inhibens TaxID=2338073 RepID=UPI00025E39AD|nr:glycosyltransferase family 25 protein [Serratia inhibens]ANS44545.1 hypothetical protein Q5A_020610 [Serratia inhibens PRI-2C]
MSRTLDLSIVEKIVYINLKSRVDRNEKLLEELRSLQVDESKILRFEAIEDYPAYLGCAKSHEAVLRMAIANGWSNILILEDDIAFNADQDSIDNVNGFLSMLNNIQWDVAMLSANYYKVNKFINNNNYIKVNMAHCACAYIINKSYYQILLENFTVSVKNLESGGEPVNYAIDSHWFSLMHKDKWFGIHPNFGYQRAGISDIQNSFTNYEYVFFKPLETICEGTYLPDFF